MVRQQMQQQLLSISAELEKDQCKGVEMRELNDTRNLLDMPFMSVRYNAKWERITLG